VTEGNVRLRICEFFYFTDGIFSEYAICVFCKLYFVMWHLFSEIVLSLHSGNECCRKIATEYDDMPMTSIMSGGAWDSTGYPDTLKS
jgi:hypothetical protein